MSVNKAQRRSTGAFMATLGCHLDGRSLPNMLIQTEDASTVRSKRTKAEAAQILCQCSVR